MKKVYVLIVAVLVVLVATSKYRGAEPPQALTQDEALEMPRSRSVFNMETADAEYIAMQAKEAKRAATERRTAAEAMSAPVAATEEISIGIHGEDQEINPYVVSAIGCLTRSGGVFNGPSGKEKWYNLPMEGVVNIMRGMGYDEAFYPYWVREDGVKMLGDYVMCAANTELRPKGSVLETSLGKALVCDHCAEAMKDYTLIDIAVAW